MKRAYVIILFVFVGLSHPAQYLHAQTGGSPPVPIEPNPSLSMILNWASIDSVVITLHLTNNNMTWGCEGIQAAVAYTAGVLFPNFAKGMVPIHEHHFAQYNWQSYSNPFLDNDGVDPDLMLYSEGPTSGNISIGANQQFNLCKMNWAIPPMTPPQAVSFSYYENTGAAGVTGYLWISDPDLRAFGAATGLSGVYFPVELRTFTARQEGGNVVLEWQTSAESNNMGFEVERRSGTERSGMGDWARIDFVRGRGTTQEPTGYMTIDMERHPAGIYQYRLRQLDYDGSASYSPVEEVEFTNMGASFALMGNYPNPVARSQSGGATRIEYQVPAGAGPAPVDLRLYDALGREVALIASGTADAGYHSVEFHAGDLPAGVYFYLLRSGSTVLSRSMLIRD